MGPRPQNLLTSRRPHLPRASPRGTRVQAAGPPTPTRPDRGVVHLKWSVLWIPVPLADQGRFVPPGQGAVSLLLVLRPRCPRRWPVQQPLSFSVSPCGGLPRPEEMPLRLEVLTPPCLHSRAGCWGHQEMGPHSCPEDLRARRERLPRSVRMYRTHMPTHAGLWSPSPFRFHSDPAFSKNLHPLGPCALVSWGCSEKLAQTGAA